MLRIGCVTTLMVLEFGNCRAVLLLCCNALLPEGGAVTFVSCAALLNISVNKAVNNKTYYKIIRKSSEFGIISNGRNDKDNKS